MAPDIESEIINNRIMELLSDHRELVAHLQAGRQAQLQSRAEEAFAKTLTVAAASYFEVRLTQIIIELYRDMTQGVEALEQFVKSQAIGRRFAQLFQWEQNRRPGRNANSFYRMFGDGFSDYMQQKIREDRELDEAVRAFLEIGNLRNQMVHGNYADFRLDRTVEDVYALYAKASIFVDTFPIAIREFIGRQHPDRAA